MSVNRIHGRCMKCSRSVYLDDDVRFCPFCGMPVLSKSESLKLRNGAIMPYEANQFISKIKDFVCDSLNFPGINRGAKKEDFHFYVDTKGEDGIIFIKGIDAHDLSQDWKMEPEVFAFGDYNIDIRLKKIAKDCVCEIVSITSMVKGETVIKFRVT